MKFKYKNEILKNKVEFKSQGSCGIYFLILNNEIVYAGQSKNNISARMLVHRHDGKTFDSYSTIDISEDSLDVIESFYIHFFEPIYNALHTNSTCKRHAPLRMSDLVDTAAKQAKKEINNA